MKLLITNSNNTIPDFLTISPLNGNNIREIDSEICADSEADEIICECVDYIPITLIVNSIQCYIKKLKKHGRITISGTDCYLLSNSISKRNLSAVEYNQRIFGGPAAHQLKMSIISVTDVIGILESLNVRVMKKQINSVNYIVEGMKL